MKGNIFISLLVGIVIGWFITTAVMSPKSPALKLDTDLITKTDNPKEFELYQGMRKLWEDHSVWTKLTIVGLVDNVPGIDRVTERLLRNPKDMANALKPYYGQVAADKFETLLTEHLKTAAQLVTESKAGDKAAEESEKNWYVNADELAEFLSSANPNWPKETVRKMLYEHLRLVKSEAVAGLQRKYDDAIKAYDLNHDHVLELADMLSEGIIKQFPDKF